MTRLPRQFLTSWVNHPRPHGRPQYTYGHSLTKSLKRTGIPPVFKEWSQLAQDRSNWRKLFYSKAEFPPTRQNWSFCSHFCMYFSHFRTSESIDVQSSAMQTHLHSKLLVIWILFGRVPYYYYYYKVERVIGAAAVDDLKGFVSWHQNWVWRWVWNRWLCIWSGFRWLCSTQHAMVHLHHEVKFYNHPFDSQNTPSALACHQKRFWGWNGNAQTCNKVNFPKHNTEGCSVTSLFHGIMLFTIELRR